MCKRKEEPRLLLFILPTFRRRRHRPRAARLFANDFRRRRRLSVIIDLLHNFHLECGARLHKLRVYETLTDPTGREVCGYLLVRGGVHAHAYALALEKITGVDIKKMLPTPNINLDKIPESQKYLDEGSHRRLYRFSADDYKEMAGIWQGEKALPGDPPGTLEVVDGPPTGGKIPELEGTPSAFAPDYAPEEMFEIATKLYKKSR